MIDTKKIKDIIITSNSVLGDISLKIAENSNKGLDNSKYQKELFYKAKYIQYILISLYNYIEFDSITGNILMIYRISDIQINKFLNCLIKLSDIQDYPIVPKLIPQSKPKILNQGLVGQKGDRGLSGTNANITVESDPNFNNINVVEISGEPKRYLLGYNPYITPLITVLFSGNPIYIIGTVIPNINISIKITKGKEDIVTVEILNNTSLNNELQNILDLVDLNSDNLEKTRILSRSNVSTNLSVTARISDNISNIESTDSIIFVYPYLFGTSDNILVQGTVFNNLTQLIKEETLSTKIIFDAQDKYFYFGFPNTYNDITTIKDGNSFIVTNDWEKVSFNVDSSGLDNNWTVGYTFFKTKIKTNITNQEYEFIQ